MSFRHVHIVCVYAYSMQPRFCGWAPMHSTHVYVHNYASIWGIFCDTGSQPALKLKTCTHVLMRLVWIELIKQRKRSYSLAKHLHSEATRWPLIDQPTHAIKYFKRALVLKLDASDFIFYLFCFIRTLVSLPTIELAWQYFVY